MLVVVVEPGGGGCWLIDNFLCGGAKG